MLQNKSLFVRAFPQGLGSAPGMLPHIAEPQVLGLFKIFEQFVNPPYR